MPYLSTIPAATDVPSSSQNDILNNFDSLNVQFGEDHVALTAGANNGFHTKVTFSQVQSDPVLTFPITELYTKTSSNSTANDRFNDLYYYERNTTGTSNVIQLTGGGVTTGAWAMISMGAGIPTLTSNYNVTSVSNTGSPNFRFVITFTRPFSNTDYVINAMVDLTGTAGVNTAGYFITSKSAGSFQVQVRADTSAQISTTAILYIVCYGILA